MKVKRNLPELKRYIFYGDEKFINDAPEKIAQQRRSKGATWQEITFKDLEKFIEMKFSRSINGMHLYKDMEIKGYIVVISRDRIHYTLTKISQILKIHFTEILLIYKTSNKNRILNESDKFSKL